MGAPRLLVYGPDKGNDKDGEGQSLYHSVNRQLSQTT
jgi:hypothetical protein